MDEDGKGWNGSGRIIYDKKMEGEEPRKMEYLLKIY